MSRLKVALELLTLALFAVLLHVCETQGESQGTQCLAIESMWDVSREEEGTGRGSSNFTETRLIPMMEITCNGTIVGWTVSGRRLGQGTQPPKLQVWRRSTSTNGDEYYHKEGSAVPIDPDADGVECEETLTRNHTFRCRLNESYQLTVQSEVDIVGIELPPLQNQSFELFFFASDSNISQYVWQHEDNVMPNASLRIGSHDAVVDDNVLLYLNISTDISPCAVNTSICDHICSDTVDSFECSCYEGYTLVSDGRSCQDTNECEEGTHNCQQNCTNVPMGGGFECDCEHGYQLDIDGKSCKDIDECLLGTHNCQELCNNTDGGFRCKCPLGYQLNSDGVNCTDIDECASSNGGCHHTMSCSNTEGSFECGCRNGYTLSSNGQLCIDIDECANNTHDCEHICHNTEGSYQCSCKRGYSPTDDGRTCTDRDECSLGTHNCEQLCVNSIGGFSCRCNESYHIAPDRTSCLDINKCEVNNGGCQHSCSNTDGSFICSCRNGYQLSKNGKSCNEKTDLITGAAVGGTLGILIITILLITLICVYITHLRRAKGMDENDHHHYSPSKKRQMKHEISLPYVVENKSFSNTLPNTRGPKILVLNATTPDNANGTNKSLEVYNSLFDSEEVAEMNSYINGDTIPT